MKFNSLKLKTLRDKKYTQKEFAHLINVSHRTYVTYEKVGDKIKVEDLLKISEKLNVSPCEFFEGDQVRDYKKKNIENKVMDEGDPSLLQENNKFLRNQVAFLNDILKDYIETLKGGPKAI